MKAKILSLITAMTLLGVMAIPMRLAGQEQKKAPPLYVITDLGTLGGTFSAASGVNNEGEVVGFSTLPGEAAGRVFLWRKGVMTDLGTLGGLNSIDLGTNPINNRGAVVGSSNTATPDPNGEDFCFDPASDICLPFVWRRGVMTPLPLFGGVNGTAFQTNNRGQTVGAAENSTPDPTCQPPQVLQLRAAIWEKGEIRELPPFPGDPDASAEAINDKGQAVGSSGPCTLISGNSFHALLWDNGRAIDLGNLGGATGNIPSQINNRGQIVGQSGRPDGFVHAFLWDDGVMTDLGTPSDNLPISQALGINEKGQVVGFAQDANSDESSSIALLWQNGTLTDLNTLIPADSPWFLQEAFSINDRGQIAGHMFNSSTGETHGFLATPCGEGDEGCGGEAAGRAAATHVSPALADQHPAALTPGGRMPVGMLNRFRLRWGQANHGLHEDQPGGAALDAETLSGRPASAFVLREHQLWPRESGAGKEAQSCGWLGGGHCEVGANNLLTGWCKGETGSACKCTREIKGFSFCTKGDKAKVPSHYPCGLVDQTHLCSL